MVYFKHFPLGQRQGQGQLTTEHLTFKLADCVK